MVATLARPAFLLKSDLLQPIQIFASTGLGLLDYLFELLFVVLSLEALTEVTFFLLLVQPLDFFVGGLQEFFNIVIYVVEATQLVGSVNRGISEWVLLPRRLENPYSAGAIGVLCQLKNWFLCGRKGLVLQDDGDSLGRTAALTDDVIT